MRATDRKRDLGVTSVEGDDFHEANGADDGWRCHPDGCDIKPGARSIPAAGIRSTVLWATKLWPAYLHPAQPAGLHRVSVSARIRRPQQGYGTPPSPTY